MIIKRNILIQSWPSSMIRSINLELIICMMFKMKLLKPYGSTRQM